MGYHRGENWHTPHEDEHEEPFVLVGFAFGLWGKHSSVVVDEYHPRGSVVQTNSIYSNNTCCGYATFSGDRVASIGQSRRSYPSTRIVPHAPGRKKTGLIPGHDPTRGSGPEV